MPPMPMPMMPPNSAPPATSGAMPMPADGGAPPGGVMQVPPEFAQHIDPNNQMQMTLLQRVDKLTPQDGEAIKSGISPAAVQVLKKVLPELGFMLDMIVQDQQPDEQQMAQGPDQYDEQQEAPEPPDGATPLRPAGDMRPGTRLARY